MTSRTALRMLTVTTLIFFAACDGSRGPVGPEGPPGPSILPTSFEFLVDLNQQNDFEFFEPIPSEIDVLDSDVFLAFVLEDFIEEENLEVWRQLPITEFNERGTLLFDFDFTLIDIRIFLDANYVLGAADEFDGVLVRGVHVPSDFLNTGNITMGELQSLTSPEQVERRIRQEEPGFELRVVNGRETRTPNLYRK